MNFIENLNLSYSYIGSFREQEQEVGSCNQKEGGQAG